MSVIYEEYYVVGILTVGAEDKDEDIPAPSNPYQLQKVLKGDHLNRDFLVQERLLFVLGSDSLWNTSVPAVVFRYRCFCVFFHFDHNK